MSEAVYEVHIPRIFPDEGKPYVIPIRDEGVQAGRTRADELARAAEDKANAMLGEATRKAEAIVGEARREAEKLKAPPKTPCALPLGTRCCACGRSWCGSCARG